MSANYTLTAVYVPAPPVTNTLTVSSSNPNSGVSITANQPDNNGDFGGSTSFSRTFNHNASVSFNAPSTAGGNAFQKWQRDGSDLTTSTTASVTMDTNHTITAVYGATLPAVQTLDASAVTTTSARLNGNVNPNGFNTTAYFQYGVSAAYGAQSPSVNLGTTPQNTYADVTGLTPGITYHFRIVANSGVGTTVGLDRTFTTTPVSGALVFQGRVTDGNGASLSGAGVAAMAGPTTVAQTITGGDGRYQLSPLSAGVYTLLCAKSGYASVAHAVTLNAPTANQDFQLATLPAPPTVQPVTRQPDLSYTIGALGSALRVFDGTQFVPIVAGNNVPPADRKTIVLTHGWNNSPTVWAENMAKQIRLKGVTASMANIVCWDWHSAAAGPLPPEERTPSQGIALGQALLGVFGSDYAQQIHFVGHSLGALVNAAAANFLHGDRTATLRQEISPTPWPPSHTHVTLLDEAEAAAAFETLGSAGVLFDGVTVSLQNSTSLIQGFDYTMLGWKPPLPVRRAWADNYVSRFGLYQPGAVNVFLGKATILPMVAAHAYSWQWYSNTVANPANCILGFQRSYEARQASLSLYDFPPSSSDFPPGVSYLQPLAASDPLQLDLLPAWMVIPMYGFGLQAVVQDVRSTMQVVGNVTAQVQSTAQATGQWISTGLNYVGNVAAQGGQTVVNLYDSAVLRLNLTTMPASGQSPLSAGGGIRPMDADGAGSDTNSPMAWLTIKIPTNSVAMAFDFTLQGDPVDDVLVCGIGQSNLFSLEAKYIPTNTISASRLLDVSRWVGTTNELFFGFMGGTSSNATLSIDNIRFYSLEQPRLQITRSGNATLLSWPSTAGGYVVETTPSLTSPSWESDSNAPAILANRYILTNSWSGQSRFFRLRVR
jgi:hypothetical protein